MSNPYQPPSHFADQPPHHPPPHREGDATGGVIPFENPYALTAYYLGLFGFICCITPIPAGLVPLVLGIIGLQKRARIRPSKVPSTPGSASSAAASRHSARSSSPSF